MRGGGPRRFRRDVDGILLLDKPLGLSSNAALQQARIIFDARKAGHAGSLDPLASGLLPVCFGQATKVCGRLLNSSKRYQVTVLLGARTESLDNETPVVEACAVPALSDAQIDAVLQTFQGAQTQTPPMHSAIRHQGKRLYELARKGESIEREPRQITIDHIQRLNWSENRLEIDVRCSKGTYIRSLAADIAARLGTLGYVEVLRRTSVDPFDGLTMYTLESLQAEQSATGFAQIESLLLTADAAFADLETVQVGSAGEAGLLKGQSVRPLVPVTTQAAGLALRAYGSRPDGAQGRFLGLVTGEADGRISPQRLFVDVVGPDEAAPAA